MTIIGKRIIRAGAGALLLTTIVAVGAVMPAHAGNVNLVIDLSGPPSNVVTPGNSASFSVTVSNSGADTATGAALNVQFPVGSTVTFATCFGIGPGVACTPFVPAANPLTDTVTIPAGGPLASYIINVTPPLTATGTFNVTATITAGAGDTESNVANNSDSVSVPVAAVVKGDLSVTTTDNSRYISAGVPTTYTIVAGNAGPGTATNANLLNIVDPTATGVTWTCTAAGGAACPQANGTGAVGGSFNLPAGGSLTYLQTLTVAAPQPTGSTNSAIIGAPAPFLDTNPANDLASDVDYPTPNPTQADLGITLTDNKVDIIPNESSDYVMVASNAGPAAAPGTTITATLPMAGAGATWSCTGSGGATCPNASGSGNINVAAALPPNGALTYSIHVPGTPSPDPWEATASINAANAAGDPTDNTARDVDGLSTVADISITKTDGTPTVLPGGTLAYIVTATNNSASSVNTVTVDDDPPATLTGVTWTCAGTAACPTVSGTGAIHETLPVMAAGTSVTYTVTGTVPAAAIGSITNTAKVTPAPTTVLVPTVPGPPPLIFHGTRDPNPANNTAADTDAIVHADLAVTLSAAGPVLTDADISYTLSLANQGDGLASANTVSMPTPPGTTFVSAAQGSGPAAALSTPAAGATGSVSATIPSLAAGASASFTIVVRLDSAVGPGAVVTASASATTITPELDLTDNAATATSSVDTIDYVPVVPDRVLETRGEGQTGYTGGKPAAGAVVELDVTGVGTSQVPNDAAAVVLNVTGTNADAPGFVTVWPCGAAQPTASNLNLVPGVSSPNLVISKIGADGRVCLFTQSAADLIADVNGYMPRRARYRPVVPERLLETRLAGQTGYAGGKPAAGATIELHVTGVGASNIPADAGAVVMNVTGTGADAAGYVTAWPCGTPQPNASNLNLAAGGTSPNLVVSKIGAGGKVCLFTQSSADLIADIAGFMPAGSSYRPVVPERLLETRTEGQIGYSGAKPAAGATIELQVTGAGATNVPAGANAVVLNVTGVGAESPGYVTVWPCGAPQPNASNLNLTTGGISPNLVMAKIGADGKVCIFTQSAADIIADVSGYWP